MALFSKKTNTGAKTAESTKAAYNADGRLASIIRAPWLSEKALIGTENGVYVFAVPPEATKHDVIAAIETIYKVTPKKIAMVNLPGKRKALRTRRGMGTRAARHKAYVYLKKGDTIQFA
jgi:large subunit ribosomal protein L23